MFCVLRYILDESIIILKNLFNIIIIETSKTITTILYLWWFLWRFWIVKSLKLFSHWNGFHELLYNFCRNVVSYFVYMCLAMLWEWYYGVGHKMSCLPCVHSWYGRGIEIDICGKDAVAEKYVLVKTRIKQVYSTLILFVFLFLLRWSMCIEFYSNTPMMVTEITLRSCSCGV